MKSPRDSRDRDWSAWGPSPRDPLETGVPGVLLIGILGDRSAWGAPHRDPGAGDRSAWGIVLLLGTP